MALPFHHRLSPMVRVNGIARQMDWARGLRAAVALCAPLLLGDLAGIPDLGWAGLGGFEAILSDTGGPYRSRLSSLLTLSLGGAAGLFLGSLAGNDLLWALAVTVFFCFVWSYLAVLGQPFSSAGVLVQVIFICGLGAPTPAWREALNHALLLLAGGAWAALLSLLLWPLDPYRPARAAVSSCYDELASFLASITELASRKQSRAAVWHRLAKHHQYRIRRVVEQGWQAVAAIRAERQAETAQGDQLVVLLETADQLIARTVALAEHLEAQTARSASRCLDRSLAGLGDLRSTELWVASLLVRRGALTAAHALAKCREMERLPPYLAACAEDGDGADRFLLTQITQSALLLTTAIESAALLRLGRTPDSTASIPFGASAGHFGYVYARLAELRQGVDFDRLRANFTSGSLSFRHALRVALVCGLDVTIIFWLHVDHGYWLLLTSLIVLQPYVSGTLRRGLERIGGTVAGGIFAALLAATLHSQLATAAVLFPLALFALTIMPVSYAAFAFFLTPAFVLAWLPYTGDWQLALIRTINTIAGALIAIVAMLFFLPAYERNRAPLFLRASVAADRRYLAQLVASWQPTSPSSRLIASARRAAGLAHNDTEESLERLLTETWPRRRRFAQLVVAFVTYLRRFAQTVTALAALSGEFSWKQSPSVESRLALLDGRLHWLEDQIASDPNVTPTLWPQPSVPALESTGPPLVAEDHPGERLLARLERQADVLRRQLTTLREQGWLPGLPEANKRG
jgi:uncharacterized membrane protein YccC